MKRRPLRCLVLTVALVSLSSLAWAASGPSSHQDISPIRKLEEPWSVPMPVAVLLGALQVVLIGWAVAISLHRAPDHETTDTFGNRRDKS